MFDASLINWEPIFSDLGLPDRPFTSGEYREATDDIPLTPKSPRDGRDLPPVHTAGPDTVDLAVSRARAAFQDGRWSRLSPRDRGQTLIKLSHLLFDNAPHLAAVIATEMGKPVREALETEMRAVVNVFRWYGEASDKLIDELPATPSSVRSLVSRAPVGVVAAIVPWNFPLTMLAWKVAPALMLGNSVVIKPAEVTPYSALLFAQLAHESGIPEGVLGVVPGHGKVTGQALARHNDVDVLAFTGSGAVGRQLLTYSGESNGKHVWLELGGKTPSVVLPDADFEEAVRATAAGCFYNQGQMCTASSRLIVHTTQLTEAQEIVEDEARRHRPADPRDPHTSFGALSSGQHLDRVSGFVERAIQGGATLVTGGRSDEPVGGGSYYQASAVTNVSPSDEIVQEEIFGPVLSILSYTAVEEAISIANDSRYGLAASLWTNDLRLAHTVSRDIEAGVVWVNCFEEGDMTMPFGGVKHSGYGRDKSLHALDKFSTLKSTWIQL